MTNGGAPASETTPREYREHVEKLVQRLGEAEGAIQALASGELDAVLDPNSAAPILLSSAQAAIAKSESRYRDLVKRSPSIVCEMSVDGRISFINEAVRTVLGHPPEDLVGSHWQERLVPDFDGAGTARMFREMRRGNVTGFEVLLRAADGSHRWIAINSANRYTPDGRLDTIVLFGADVTDRRFAEDRARDLSEAQVARAEAEASNRAKTEFLAVMSHELRTPLNAILGYVQLMEMGLRGPVTDGQVGDLQRIRRSTLHLLGLINNILNFARLDAGHVEFHPEAVAIQTLFDTLESIMTPLTAEKSIELEVRRCPEDVYVYADPEKVQQILINLVNNAVKFTLPGGRIILDCLTEPNVVRIAVTDTGQGIPHDKLARIFEPFVQLEKPLTRPQDGIGLGLAISRDLARAMKGEIGVVSVTGVGSTFTLVLSRAAVDPAI